MSNKFQPTNGTVILPSNLFPLHDRFRTIYVPIVDRNGDSAITSERLPVGAFAVCDEENFFKIKLGENYYAVSAYYLDNGDIRIATDEDGNKVKFIATHSHYVRAIDKNGNDIYFTSERAAELNNYKFSLNYGYFCHADDKDRLYGSTSQFGYHTSQGLSDRIKDKLPKFHNENDEFLVGLEVEKNDARYQNSGLGWEIAEKSGWIRERDGSLGSYGYELVSPILPLFDDARIQKSIAPVADLINGNADSACGGHINISRKGVTEASELLESFKQFAAVLYALYPHRLGNSYCKAKKWQHYFDYNEKYSAFNRKGNGIVEIRLFGKVKNVETINWRLGLLRLLLPSSGKQKNLNQIAQQIGCQESKLYKHLAKQYSHAQIGEKLVQIDKLAKDYGTHRNGVSDSVKRRINNTMGFDVFSGVPESDEAVSLVSEEQTD